MMIQEKKMWWRRCEEKGFGEEKTQDMKISTACDLPLAFSLIIPTFKITGQLVKEGYNATNGQFIF